MDNMNNMNIILTLDSWSWCTAGGYTDNYGSYTDEVLLYNSEEDEWTTVGHMSKARTWHAVSLVPGNIVDHCLK